MKVAKSIKNYQENNNMKIAIGVFILSFLMACSEQAKVIEVKHKVEHSQAELLIFDYLQQQAGDNKRALGPADLQLISEETDHLGMTHVKFQQIYKSILVWSKELFAHINTQNEVFRITENIALIPENFSVKPGLSIDEIDQYAMKAINKKGVWKVKKSSLVIYVNPDGVVTLAYQLELIKGLFREFVFLDAQNGDLLYQLTGTYTHS